MLGLLLTPVMLRPVVLSQDFPPKLAMRSVPLKSTMSVAMIGMVSVASAAATKVDLPVVKIISDEFFTASEAMVSLGVSSDA